MSTTWSDVAHDLWMARMLREEEQRAGLRDRSYEASEFVAASVTRWLTASGASILRVHPQEVIAGKTPIGPRVRIRIQAARTPIRSSLDDMARREQIHVQVRGYPVALALPDLPRLRRAAARVVAALPPEKRLTWIFVGRYGQIDVVTPPRPEDEAEPDATPMSAGRPGS